MSDLKRSKRKAADNLQTTRNKRVCHGLNNPPTSKQPKPKAKKAFEPTSLLSIIHNNSHDRLYVKPIAWKSAQLEHLDCKFKAQDDQGSTKHALSRHLSRKPLSRSQIVIEDLLRECGYHYLGGEILPFYFGDKNAAKVETEGVFSTNPPAANLACTTFDRIQALREAYVNRHPCSSNSVPVIELRKKQLRSLEPRDRTQDPYIVAILIALAQKERRCALRVQEYRNTLASEGRGQDNRRGRRQEDDVSKLLKQPVTESFKVRVLAISGPDADVLYVYTAEITTAFLHRFEKPWSGAPSMPVVVKWRCIPLYEAKKVAKEHVQAVS